MFKMRNKAYPIGIDLGSASLKMVQLTEMEGGLGIVAAAKEDVPGYVQGHATALQEWYAKTIKEILVKKPFKGQMAVTCLPAMVCPCF
jgi:Tfp pilus assembly PilM family ATPase